MADSDSLLSKDTTLKGSFFNSTNSSFYLPLAIFILNFILKIWCLDRRDLAMDEPFTVFFAQADLPDLFIMLKSENNPPLFFLLLHFWIKIFGISPISVRFLPMIFSSLTAVIIYLTGRRYLTGRVGLVAALLYTFSNYHMIFAHESRVYSLFAMLAALSMFIFFSFKSRKALKSIIFLAIVNALHVYSHFFGFILLLTQVIIITFIPQFRKRIGIKYLLSLAGTFLLYLPYIPFILFRFTQTIATGTWVDKPVVSDLYTMVWRYSNAPVVTVILLVLLFSGTGYYMFRLLRRQTSANPVITAIMIWFFIPYLLMFLLSYKQPLFLDRYTVFISVGYYLLIAVSIDLLCRPKWLPILLNVIVVGMMLFTFTPNPDNKRRFSEAVHFVKSIKTPATAVIICPSWLEYGFSYHYDLSGFRDYPKLRTHLNAGNIFPISTPEEIGNLNLEKNTRIIYFEEWAPIIDKEGKIRQMLDARFNKITETVNYKGFRIHLYIRKICRNDHKKEISGTNL